MHRHASGAARLIALTAMILSDAATAEAQRTTADGVYTTEQAEQGLEVHQKYCARCHQHSYFQDAFLISWRDQPVSALYDVIELKMPEDRPGALAPPEYAALLAYVFELNGLPAGREKLAHDREELARILITDE